MREKTVQVPAISAVPAGIAASQAANGGVQTLTSSPVQLVPPRRVTITSGANLSGLNVTITGTDRGGSKITETLAGPNVATVTTSQVFSTITGLSTSAANAGTFTVGWSAESVSPWVGVGRAVSHAQWKMHCFFPAGASGSYEIEGTSQNMYSDNVTGDLPDNVINLATGQTGNYVSDNDTPWFAVRVRLTAGGPLTFRILPTRTV
jgi:hypothetical protein